MNAKTVRISNILAAIMLLINVVCIFLNLLLSWLMKTYLISLPAGIFLCFAVMLPSVVLLIYGIKRAKCKQGVFDLIASIVTLLVSLVWALLSLTDWGISVARNVIIELYYRLNIGMPLGQLLNIVSYVSSAFTLFTTLVALYLLIAYVISVLRSKKKWLQIKAELHKPALAVLLLGTNLLWFLHTIFGKILGDQIDTGMITLESYSTYTLIANYAVLGIQILLTVAAAVLLLTFGLIIKKQAQPKQDATLQEMEQPLQNQSNDLPFNLPAGVNSDDL